jgi:trehalose/maltose hydrolase-like predicted phosphorylase
MTGLPARGSRPAPRAAAPARRRRVLRAAGPAGIPDRRFEAFVFDWDGTAVPDRRSDATAVRERVESLCAAGADVYVVSGTHVGNVDGQLAARPAGPGRLYLCLNRGSEVFAVGSQGPELVYRRTATPDEDDALDRAAAATVQRLSQLGLRAEVVSQRINRRKIDLIPEPAWADPPKAIIDRLLGAVLERLRSFGIDDLAEAVGMAREAALGAGIGDPRVTSDVKHVEIGLTDKSDSMRWALDDLARRGIGPGLVIVAGDEFGALGGATGSDALMLIADADRVTAVSVGVEPNGVPSGVVSLGGGPKRFLALLDDQIERWHTRRVPAIDEDPEWCIALNGEHALSRVHETLLSLTEAPFGLRGALEEDGVGADPLLVAGGVFDRRGTDTMLAEGPVWTRLEIANGKPHSERRVLDMRTGVVVRERTGGRARVRTLRFLAANRPGIGILRAEGPAGALSTGTAFFAPPKGGPFQRGDARGIEWARIRSRLGGGIVSAATTIENVRDGTRVVDRIAVVDASQEKAPHVTSAAARVRRLDSDRLLAGHRESWAARWRDAAVTIDGDPDAQLAARFALFQLLGLAGDEGQLAVGPRGVSGRAYGGHVFWDADVFVLPALAAIRPAAARAMLEYRLRRLDAARRGASQMHEKGARFPWESADSGEDVTPRLARTTDGRVVPIRTGQHELHIVADVAWGAWRYASWSGDDAFLDGPGRSLVTETARYWASRARWDRTGCAHLYGVTGPDEYHEIVDDNAFTNVMARWNLRRAAELVKRDGIGADPDEVQAWLALADRIVDGYDPKLRLYEQFSGFHSLEPLKISEISRTPVAADVLLGSTRVRNAQVIKQPDVLMLHHLVPEEVEPGSLHPNLAYYGPRTAHGSSLSPAIQASLLARAGEPDAALEPFRLASRMDLDDLTGTTAAGLHIATIGGVWQALAFGFLGLSATGDTLAVAPSLPRAWEALDLTFRFRGRRVRVRAEHGSVTVTPDAPLRVRPNGRPATTVLPEGATFLIDGNEDNGEGEPT